MLRVTPTFYVNEKSLARAFQKINVKIEKDSSINLYKEKRITLT